MFLNRNIQFTLLIQLFVLILSCESDNNPSQDTPQNSIDFVSTYGGSKNDKAQSITKTSDGGYAILGYTQSNDEDITDKPNEGYDYWVLKFDSNNTLQWSKTYGGSEDDRGYSITQTPDGGYALLGYSYSNDLDVTLNAGLQDYWVVKLDASGNINWQESFGYPGLDSGISFTQTNDNGFLLIGVLDVTASEGEGNTKLNNAKHAGGDYWAIKLDASGNKQWSKYYGGSFTDTPYDVVQTNDNGYLIVGSSDSNDVDISNNLGEYDFWVIKISATGELIWEKSYGGSQIDEARSIAATNDGNYIIVGDTRSNDLDVSQNFGGADVWVIKISPIGEIIWEKSFGGSSFDISRSIKATQDNGFLISGSSRSANGDLTKNQGQNDAWVFKINSEGSLLWQKSFGGSNIDYAYDATELHDNSVIIVGESESNDGDITENKGFSDVLIIKIN
ncbi:hypothetical protein [Xanthomarina spongicola]|uniref:Bulb-type lectin domain-containing protein n=1 Tax=Xanthomarina spongicola TaxID=570520 RepID=A0A316DR72_9FLAO|nr:hypothetical protein [Xanthomarina spongicola]PWK20336.1 hypothetical protein LX78_00035 [Xanthomarina spongicola]